MDSAPWSQRSTGSAPTSARGGRRSASPPSSTSSFEYVPTYQQQLQPPTMFAASSSFNRPRPSSAGSNDGNKSNTHHHPTQLRQKPAVQEPLGGARGATTTASFFSSLSRPTSGLTLTTTTTTATASSAELFSMDDDDDDAWGVDSPSAVLGSTPFSDDEQPDDLGGGWDDMGSPTSAPPAPVAASESFAEKPSPSGVTLAVEASQPAPPVAHSVVAASIVSPTAALTTATGDFWGDEGDDGLFSDEEIKPAADESEVEIEEAVAEMSLQEQVQQPDQVPETHDQEVVEAPASMNMIAIAADSTTAVDAAVATTKTVDNIHELSSAPNDAFAFDEPLDTQDDTTAGQSEWDDGWPDDSDIQVEDNDSTTMESSWQATSPPGEIESSVEAVSSPVEDTHQIDNSGNVTTLEQSVQQEVASYPIADTFDEFNVAQARAVTESRDHIHDPSGSGTYGHFSTLSQSHEVDELPRHHEDSANGGAHSGEVPHASDVSPSERLVSSIAFEYSSATHTNPVDLVREHGESKDYEGANDSASVTFGGDNVPEVYAESRQLTSFPESGDVGSVKSFAGLSSVGATCGDSENDPASEIGDVDESYSDGNASEARSVFGSSSAGTAFITEPPSSSDGQISVYDDGGMDTGEPVGSLRAGQDTYDNHYDQPTDAAIADPFDEQPLHSASFGTPTASFQSSETEAMTSVQEYSHADEGRVDNDGCVESEYVSHDAYINPFEQSNFHSAAVDPFIEQSSHSSSFGPPAVSSQSLGAEATTSVQENSRAELSDGMNIDHQWGAGDIAEAAVQSSSSPFNDVSADADLGVADAPGHRTHFGGDNQSADEPFKSNDENTSQPALTFGESSTTSFFPSVEQTESLPEQTPSDYIPSAASLFGAESSSPEKEGSPFSAFQQPSHYQSHVPPSLDTSPTDSAAPDTGALFGSTSTPGSPFDSYNAASANEYFGSSSNYGGASSPYGSQFAPTHSVNTSHSQFDGFSRPPQSAADVFGAQTGFGGYGDRGAPSNRFGALPGSNSFEDASPAPLVFGATSTSCDEGSLRYEGSVHSEQRSSLTPSLSRASLSSQVSQSSSRPAHAEQQDNYGRHQESHNDYMIDGGNVESTAQFFGHPSATEIGAGESDPQSFFSSNTETSETQAIFNSQDHVSPSEYGSTQVPSDRGGAKEDAHQQLSTDESAGLFPPEHNYHQTQSSQFGAAQAPELFDHHQHNVASHQSEIQDAGDIDFGASHTDLDKAPQQDDFHWANPELPAHDHQPFASAGETSGDHTRDSHTHEPEPYVGSDGHMHHPEQTFIPQHQPEYGGGMFSDNSSIANPYEDPFAGTSAPSNDFFSSSVAQSVGYVDPSQAIHPQTQVDYHGYEDSSNTFAASTAYADSSAAQAFTGHASSSQNVPEQNFSSSESPSTLKTLHQVPQGHDHRQDPFAQPARGISQDPATYFHPQSPSFQGASPSPHPVMPPQEVKGSTPSPLTTPPAYNEMGGYPNQVTTQGYNHTTATPPTMSTVHQSYYSSPKTQAAAFSTPVIKTSQKYKDPTQVAPSCLASFGFGGNVVTMFPKRKLRLNAASLGGGARHSPRMPGGQPFDSPQGELRKGPVSVYRMTQLHPRTKEYEEADSFPGPLTSNVSEETILDYIEHKLQVLGSTARTATEEDERLLMGVLKVLIKCNGRLRSELSGNPSDPASPEVQLVTLLKESDQRRRRTHPYVFPTPKPVHYPSHPDATTRNATRIRELLLLGDRKAAVEVAIQAQMWPEAMLIASFTDKDEYKRVLCAYFSTHYAPGDPSRALFLCFADQQEKSVHEPQKLMATAGHTGESEEISPVLSSWVVHVQMLLANRTADTNKILIELGDRLWKESGAVVAAHVCYLLGGLTVEAPSHHSKIALLGGDHRTPEQSRFYVSPATVQRTEIYEWVQKKRTSTASSSGPGSNSQVPMIPFQGYKLIHAMMLVDYGKLETAFKYVNAMLTVLRSVTATMKPGTSMYLEGMQNQLTVLDDRLRQHLGQDRAESVAATVNAKQGKWGLGSALSIMGKIVNRVVEGGDVPNQATGPPSSNGSLFPGAPRSNNATLPPDYPSASAMGLPYPTSQAAPLSNDRHTMAPPSYGSSAPSSHSHGGNLPTTPAYPHDGQMHHSSVANPAQSQHHAPMTPHQLYGGPSPMPSEEQASGHIVAPPVSIPTPTPSSSSAKFVAYRPQSRNTAAQGSNNRDDGPVARPSSVPPPAATTQPPTPLYDSSPQEQQQWYPPQDHHHVDNSQPPAPPAPAPAPKFQKPTLDLSSMSASTPPPGPSGDEHVRRSSESMKPKSPRSPRDGPGSDKGSASPKFKDTKKSGRSKTPPPSRSSSGWLSGLSSFIATKINPEVKVAKLGEQMEAYFDEEKKRWVFPGETPADEPTIPSAPPTGPLPGSTPTSSSGGPPVGPPGTHSAPGSMAGSAPDDPLAALMAPPTSRAHAALMKKDPVSAMMAPPSRPMYGQRASTMPATRRPPRPQFAVFKPKAPAAEDQSAPSDGDAQ